MATNATKPQTKNITRTVAAVGTDPLLELMGSIEVGFGVEAEAPLLSRLIHDLQLARDLVTAKFDSVAAVSRE